MFKPQMRFQKILYIGLLIVAAATFIYAIGLCTDLYPLYLSEAIGSVDGAEYYEQIQNYNADLVKFSIIVILASVLPFIFASNTRRKYYLDNLISNIIQGLIYIACSIFLIVKTFIYKALYFQTVDIEAYIEYCEKKKYFAPNVSGWFNFGYVMAIILIVSVLLLTANYIWKVILVKNENKCLNEGASK